MFPCGINQQARRRATKCDQVEKRLRFRLQAANWEVLQPSRWLYSITEDLFVLPQHSRSDFFYCICEASPTLVGDLAYEDNG